MEKQDRYAGVVLKGVGGFYEVRLKDGPRVTAKAKGTLKRGGGRVIVGDRVAVCRPVRAGELWVIEEVFKRKSMLDRPLLANATQGVIVSSMQSPQIVTLLVDTMLVNFKAQGLSCALCFSKSDLIDEKTRGVYEKMYENACAHVCFTSAKTKEGLATLKEILEGRISVFAGVSGAGKSSLLNALTGARQQTGSLSEKSRRGRHTTRESEMFLLGEETFIVDTPGFSNVAIAERDPYKLGEFYEEFKAFLPCRFASCLHKDEPGCRVREAALKGEIPLERYENYKTLLSKIQQTGRKRR